MTKRPARAAGLAAGFSASRPLVLVGAGKMGLALLAGWLDAGLDRRAVVVLDPSPAPDSAAFLRKHRLQALAAAPEGVTARVIVVAVKPQIIMDVLPGLRPLVGRATVAVSVAAGTTLKNLEAGLGPAAIVRTIPNTPAQVGRGITAAVANDRVAASARALATRLLSAVGEVVWVPREADIDTVTAVSGSGPAYVFLLAETLAAAGVSAGLEKETAERLARATVAGAGELLHRSDLPAATLRENVTSPNGTTAAALAVLMARVGGLKSLMRKAVAAAKKRSRELSA